MTPSKPLSAVGKAKEIRVEPTDPGPPVTWWTTADGLRECPVNGRIKREDAAVLLDSSTQMSPNWGVAAPALD